MKVAISPEGVKVLGSLLAQAGDIGAARRVSLEVCAALSEIDGVAMPGAVDGAASIVVDAVGDLDWAGTAASAGWLSPESASDLLAECEAARNDVAQFSAHCEALTVECADLTVQRIAADGREAELRRDVDGMLRELKTLRDAAGSAPAPVSAPAQAPVKLPVAPVQSAPSAGGRPADQSKDAWDRMPATSQAWFLSMAARKGIAIVFD